MNDLGQHQMKFSGSPQAQQHRRRGIYLLPSLLTVANMLCGFYAVLSILMDGERGLDFAARAIGLAILFDSFDGFIARATGTASDFGKQFDSLADVISFGIAPAFLSFAWGVRGVTPAAGGLLEHIHSIGWWVSFAFLLCSAWRLARFNVHGMAPGGSRYFVGMPTPAAAGMVAATVHAFKVPLEDWKWSVAWLCLVISLAALMTSRIRHFSFKDIPWKKRLPSTTVVLMGLLLAVSIVLYSEVVLMLIAASYALSGITLQVVRTIRHRFASHPAPSP